MGKNHNTRNNEQKKEIIVEKIIDKKIEWYKIINLFRAIIRMGQQWIFYTSFRTQNSLQFSDYWIIEVRSNWEWYYRFDEQELLFKPEEYYDQSELYIILEKLFFNTWHLKL